MNLLYDKNRIHCLAVISFAMWHARCTAIFEDKIDQIKHLFTSYLKIEMERAFFFIPNIIKKKKKVNYQKRFNLDKLYDLTRIDLF